MPAFLTTSGLQKFAVATPENPVTVKYMAIGTGAGTVSENIQSLFNEVYRTEIPNPLRDEDNPRNLEFTGYIPTTVGGWTITELGLYDDSGVLIGYHLLDESIVKSSPESALKTDMYPTFVLALSNASDVELFVSSSIEFDHEALTGREKNDSHPISAITGLQSAIDASMVHGNLSGRSAASSHPISAISGLQEAIDGSLIHGNLSGRDSADSHPITAVTGLEQEIARLDIGISANQTELDEAIALADLRDAQNVKLTGNQTIAGQKTFNSVVKSTGIESVSGRAFVGLVDGAMALITRTGSLGEDAGLSLIAGSTPQVNITGKLVGDGSGLNMLGWGQTWQNVAGARAIGATYTNTTGRPIMVNVSIDQIDALAILSLSVGGVVVATVSNKENWSNIMTMSAIVPSGATYVCSGTGTPTIGLWSELR